jgi:outer membrane immunogenic protein
MGSLRARAGFTPIDRALIYVTGGVAWAGIDHTASPPGVAPFVFSGSYDQTRVGWALGGGGEYAFTNQISAKVEYVYYGFGSNTSPMGTLSAANTASLKNGVNLIDVGLNYHF